MVFAGPRIAFIKLLQAREDAETLRGRIGQHLAQQTAPELAAIRLVRGPADFDPQMAEFATAFLSHVWNG